jgi:hypothetical protein
MAPLLIARLLILAPAFLGAFAAFNISYAQWTGTAPCPSIGIIPACYVVLAGYGLILLSAVLLSRIIFLIGWLPVLLLAAVGTISELLYTAPVCPRTEGGIPQCFLSLALIGIIGLLGLYLFTLRART